jgi:two-component system sensor histidine kinase CreC
LQNALNFSPPNGTIAVTVSSASDRREVKIMVEDEGPGIPPYALERVFERFYSLPHPTTGKKSSGLGLCFVREAAELHGGTATLENRPTGKGARAVLVLKTECSSSMRST